MSRLLGISIQNFGVLKNVRLGRLADDLEAEPLGTMTTFIGPNGTGKTTLIGVFEFLADCFRYGVPGACGVRNPGGFSRICSQGSDNTIHFELFFEVSPKKPSLTYSLTLKAKNAFESFIDEEKLTQDVGEAQKLLFHIKEGVVTWLPESISGPIRYIGTNIEKDDSLSVHMPEHFRTFPFLFFYSPFCPNAAKFLSFLGNSYLCSFSSESASKGKDLLLTPYLNRTCSNLNNVAVHLAQSNKLTLEKINKALQTKIPNFDRIEPITMANGQYELAIYQKSSPEPLYSANASAGTLKLFAYYLLLSGVEGTTSRKLVCIEEPENGLYHTYLPDLAGDIATRASKGRQIFVTTHSPYFVNALFPKDVWVLSRGTDGFAQVRRATEFPFVNELFNEEIPVGDLWHNEYLEGEV